MARLEKNRNNKKKKKKKPQKPTVFFFRIQIKRKFQVHPHSHDKTRIFNPKCLLDKFLTLIINIPLKL